MTLAEAMDMDLAPTIKSVLVAIVVKAAENKGICAASVPDLCRATSLCRRTIFNALTALERAGLLEIERRRGRGQTSRYRPKRCIKGARREIQISQSNQQKGANVTPINGKSPYRDDVQRDPCTLSRAEQAEAALADMSISAEVKELSARTKLIIRRQQVRDGYLSFIAMLNPDQYVTASALAKELGMTTTQVRTALDALFRSMDISVDDQERLRKSQRRHAHRGKMWHPKVNHFEHGPS